MYQQISYKIGFMITKSAFSEKLFGEWGDDICSPLRHFFANLRLCKHKRKWIGLAESFKQQYKDIPNEYQPLFSKAQHTDIVWPLSDMTNLLDLHYQEPPMLDEITMLARAIEGLCGEIKQGVGVQSAVGQIERNAQRIGNLVKELQDRETAK